MLSWCMKGKQQHNATEGEGGGGNPSIDPDHVSTFSEGRPMKQHNEIPAALLDVTMCLLPLTIIGTQVRGLNRIS